MCNDDNKNLESQKEAFKKFMEAKYATFGANADMVFRTSRELAYECREMCEPSLLDVATVMTELGYASNQFLGQYTWVLYEIEELRY